MGLISCEKPTLESSFMSTTHSTAIAIRESIARCSAEGGWRNYHGKYSETLKESLAAYFSRDHVRLCSSGTLGVELALRSLQLSPDREVLLVGYDYPGNLRAVLDAGLRVSVADVRKNSWVSDVEQLDAATSPDTRVVVISHLHGQLAPMHQICAWARSREYVVIEDACQEPGALLDAHPRDESLQSVKRVGGMGDLSVLSFGGSKVLAAGRGGAVLTNNPRFAQRMTIFCERGNDAFALSELQAAALVPQLQHLDADNQLRQAAAMDLLQRLQTFPWLKSFDGTVLKCGAFYKLGLLVDPHALVLSRVQRFVKKHYEVAGVETADDMQLARDCIVEICQEMGLSIGPGFRSLAARRRKNLSRVSDCINASTIASTTIVLHHTHLLDPETGQSDVGWVMEKFCRVNERLHD
jgi:dTDP-4-amino-4,6-dideoxygalactose transaminase